MNKPLVSVVIPAYNCIKTICEAIDSVRLQKVPLEIIVVDDCSTDDLYAGVQKYESDERFRYVKNPVNCGVAQTRNNGVSIAQGEYVAFLDADDVWAKDKLEKQIARIKETNSVMCCTARDLINSDGDSIGRIIPIKEVITYKELLKQNPINCSSVVIRTDVAKEFPMHSDDCHEDYIMWLEVLSKYKTCCAVNEPLLKYRMSNNGKSGSKFKSAKMTFMVYRRIGFGWIKSFWCFSCYAFNGIKKYFF